MENENFIIRNMERRDMDTIMSWAVKENWNPGLSDSDNFYYTDPEGFFIAEYNGEPVSCVSAVRYEEHFGFIGMYLARKEFKGKGFGLKVFNAGMEFLKGRNIGLDGVMMQEENYKKSGFKTVYYNHRYEGIGFGERQNGVIDISEVPFDKLVEYDTKHFPAKREKFLEMWIRKPNTGLAVTLDNRILGYGVIRPLQTGYRIGPLFAENNVVADNLLQSLISISRDQKYYLDVPEVNKSSIIMMDKYKANSVYKTARMYTGDFPKLPVENIYALTSLALG
jgi:hypothetical protein